MCLVKLLTVLMCGFIYLTTDVSMCAPACVRRFTEVLIECVCVCVRDKDGASEIDSVCV